MKRRWTGRGVAALIVAAVTLPASAQGPQTEKRIALVIGDGAYASWWGLDDAGAPVALYLDFDLLTELETDDAEFELPLGRGKLAHPVLALHGARARVPWLASNKLRVRYQPSKSVHARWKLPQGKYVRIGAKLRANGTDYVLGTPPESARLVLRVSVGMRRMKVLAT